MNPKILSMLAVCVVLLSPSWRQPARSEDVAEAQPHIIGVQEVSLIRQQIPGDMIPGGTVPAEDVLFDYLEILLGELASLGLDYEVAGIIENIDIDLPMIVDPITPQFHDIRFTDFDGVLARQDVAYSNAMENNYQAMLDPTPFDIPVVIPRGYIALDAQVGHKTYRFVNTHLEPFIIPGLVPVKERWAWSVHPSGVDCTPRGMDCGLTASARKLNRECGNSRSKAAQ